jgi:hypothetical protein
MVATQFDVLEPIASAAQLNAGFVGLCLKSSYR